MKRVFIFCLLLVIVSCEKDKNNESDKLFANLEINEQSMYYSEKDSIYFDRHYQSSIIGGDYQYGGGFANSNYRIENLEGTIYDIFSIKFQNIPFDSINNGFYNIIGKKRDGTFVNEGIEIIWMNPETWEHLFDIYVKSDDLVSCEESNPNYNCLNNIGDYLFLTTSSVINESQIEITKTFHKEYETYWHSDSSYHTSTDLIVEGTISNCKVSSRIDEKLIKNLNGNFRIHIPAPKPLFW